MSAQIRRCGQPTMRWIQVVIAGCSFSLIAGSQVAIADSAGASMRLSVPSAAAAQSSEYEPNYWMGKNISDVIKVFGHPTYWNANHDGGGGGNRYFYTNPNQPHFVFETEPGQIIVHAVRIP
jgi:hypothetical protein